MATPRNALNRQHPFVARLLSHVDLAAADLDSLDAIIDGELTIRRRRDLIIDGYAVSPDEEYPLSMEYRRDGMSRVTVGAVLDKVRLAMTKYLAPV